MNANRMCSTMTTLAAAAILCCAPAFAQNGMGQQQNPNTQTTTPSGTANGNMNPNMRAEGMNGSNMDNMGGGGAMGDKAFIRSAAQGGLAEVQLGQLALQKSSNDQVKQFAQRMVDDHTKLNDQMKPIAEQMNVTVPTEPSSKDKATMTKLQGLSGADFDKAYMKDMVKDHEKDLKEFKAEASSAKDPQLKSAAQQGSSVISEHLQMAKQIASSVGAGSGKSGKMQNTTANTSSQGAASTPQQ